jgi:hypothetical protein
MLHLFCKLQYERKLYYLLIFLKNNKLSWIILQSESTISFFQVETPQSNCTAFVWVFWADRGYFNFVWNDFKKAAIQSFFNSSNLNKLTLALHFFLQENVLSAVGGKYDVDQLIVQDFLMPINTMADSIKFRHFQDIFLIFSYFSWKMLT